MKMTTTAWRPVTRDQALSRHRVDVTANRTESTKSGRPRYLWTVHCDKSRRPPGGGRIDLHTGDSLHGRTAEERGRDLMEHLVWLAYLVEGSLGTDGTKPEWLSKREWRVAHDVREELHRSLPPAAYFDLIHSDEGPPTEPEPALPKRRRRSS